jgi:hypothetical protein
MQFTKAAIVKLNIVLKFRFNSPVKPPEQGPDYYREGFGVFNVKEPLEESGSSYLLTH